MQASNVHIHIFDLDETLLKHDLLMLRLPQVGRDIDYKIDSDVDSESPRRAGPHLRMKSWVDARVPRETIRELFRESILERMRDLKRGDPSNRVYVFSASLEPWVKEAVGWIAEIDGVFGSKGSENLKGRTKLAKIQKEFPGMPFAYYGDSKADLEVWRGAAHAVVVNPTSRFLARVRQVCPSVEVIRDDARPVGRLESLSVWARAIRVHQWSKNALVFLPLLGSHEVLNLSAALQALGAFVAFSFIASATYIFNDWTDIENDLQHPSKRERPIASAKVRLHDALLLGSILFISGFILSAVLAPWLFVVLTAYFGLNLFYTFFAKSRLFVDVVLLALLYMLRIFAGSAATDIPLSPWLLNFCLFFFLGLALLKRYIEISRLPKERGALILGRGYVVTDAPVVLSLGTGASLASVLTFALYLDSPQVRSLYLHPEVLGLSLPIILYWIGRIWILASRGQVNDDPVVFALKDRTSWYLVAAFAVVMFCGTLG